MTNRISFSGLEYADEFLRYLIDHPEDVERIPDGAVVLFITEELDPGFSFMHRLVMRTPDAYRGKTIMPVGVRPAREGGPLHQFVFPWSGSNVWVRLDRAEWIQEYLTAAGVVQTEDSTRYCVDRPIYIVPRIEEKPVAVQAA